MGSDRVRASGCEDVGWGQVRRMNGGYALSTEVPQIASVTYEPVAGDISSRVGRDNVRAGLGTPEVSVGCAFFRRV